MQYVQRGTDIILDAENSSYDPENPTAPLAYSWSCFNHVLGDIPMDKSIPFPSSSCEFPSIYDEEEGVIHVPIENKAPVANITFRVIVRNRDNYATYDQKVIIIKDFVAKLEIG